MEGSENAEGLRSLENNGGIPPVLILAGSYVPDSSSGQFFFWFVDSRDVRIRRFQKFGAKPIKIKITVSSYRTWMRLRLLNPSP